VATAFGKLVHIASYIRALLKDPPVAIVKGLEPELAKASQKIYDAWDQDEEGNDVELGSGGICQDIADAISGVLSHHGVDTHVFSQTVGEQHVYTVAKFKEGIYSVDIPFHIYETGAGYNWKKKPGVTFKPGDISVHMIEDDLTKWPEFIDD
jgi:hypothetical protein